MSYIISITLNVRNDPRNVCLLINFCTFLVSEKWETAWSSKSQGLS